MVDVSPAQLALAYAEHSALTPISSKSGLIQVFIGSLSFRGILLDSTHLSHTGLNTALYSIRR